MGGFTSTYNFVVALAVGCAGDAVTGGVDVDDVAVVGEARDDVALAGGADGADTRRGGRRGVLSIDAVVSGGDGNEDARFNERIGRVVAGLAVSAAERHVDDGARGAAARRVVPGREVHRVQDRASGRNTVGVEDLEAVKLGLLGDAVGVGADNARHVSAVPGAVPVLAVPDEVLQERRPPAEVIVRLLDARVDHVHARALACRLVVYVVGTARIPVRNPRDAPGRVRLGGEVEKLHVLVLLDVRYLEKAYLVNRHSYW